MSKTSFCAANGQQLFDRQQAAHYCGLDADYFWKKVRRNQGPTITRPSPHTALFRQCDLDTWIASWRVVKAKPCDGVKAAAN